MPPIPKPGTGFSKLIVGVLLFFTAIFLFNSFFGNISQSNEISYSTLITQLDRSNIALLNIHITGRIEGEFRSAIGNITKFTSNINTELIPSLDEKAKSSSSPPEILFSNNSEGGIILMFYTFLPFLFIIGILIFFMRRMDGQGNKAMSFGKSRAKLVSNEKPKTFQDVAGQDEAKEELQEIVEFLKDPTKFQKLGGHIPKGVLLMGPPGTGKTLLARAVAGEAQVPFFSISGSDFVEMFVGVGASRVRDLFLQGKKNAPCIIFIDEIDAVGRHRGAGLGGGHDEREQTLNQLLGEMDGFESNEGVIIVAATNRPDVLDPALLRPGRFDRRVVVNRPDIKGREGILHVHTKTVPVDENVDLHVIARGTPGFSGADLANLVNEAALNAARLNHKVVEMTDFEFAKDKVMMGSERRSMVISNEQKRITAIHEAGHAFVATQITNTDPVHKVTIIPRGLSLGSTSMLPEEDQHNYSKAQLISRIAVLLGGRGAEEVFNGSDNITNGASNDIERATEIAQKMVCEWGMSEKIGLVQHISEGENPFLGKKFSEANQSYSENTAEIIDQEIKEIITTQYTRVKKLIEESRDLIQKIAEELITKETLNGEEVRKLLNIQEPK